MGTSIENITNLAGEMKEAESAVCNMALIFAEMIKDEINANDERRLYNGVQRLLGKYSGDNRAIEAINEFTGVLSGGASLEEIIRVALDEARDPSAATDISVDTGCEKH